MAYALVSWDAPPGADTAQITADISAALSLRGGTKPATRFHDRLFLYPSPASGIGFSTVRDRLSPVVRNHPGLEVMIIMPEKDSTVAGWVDPSHGSFPDARPIMNTASDGIYPRILRVPTSGGGGS